MQPIFFRNHTKFRGYNIHEYINKLLLKIINGGSFFNYS
jgi:hypothetical protein